MLLVTLKQSQLMLITCQSNFCKLIGVGALQAYADASGLKEKLAETEKELERTKQQLQR